MGNTVKNSIPTAAAISQQIQINQLTQPLPPITAEIVIREFQFRCGNGMQYTTFPNTISESERLKLIEAGFIVTENTIPSSQRHGAGDLYIGFQVALNEEAAKHSMEVRPDTLLAGVSETVTTISHAMDVNNQQLHQLNTQIAQSNSLLAEIDSDIDTSNVKLDELDSGIDTTNDKLDITNDGINTTNDILVDVQNTATDISTSVQHMEQDTEVIKTVTEDAKTSVENIETETIALRDQADILNDTLHNVVVPNSDAIKASVDDLSKDVSEIKQELQSNTLKTPIFNSVGLIGMIDGSGTWDSESYELAYDNGIWSIELEFTGGTNAFRARANDSWDIAFGESEDSNITTPFTGLYRISIADGSPTNTTLTVEPVETTGGGE